MARTRSAPGGGTVVEVEPERLTGWVNRFAGRNQGLADIATDTRTVTLTGGDGTTAAIAVPFPPLSVGHREPIEALLDHLSGLGAMGIILARGGAHSVGVARDGVVLSSSTDRAYLQGRTAAGGWSQQRYARRRGNQVRASHADAADTAARVLGPIMPTLRVLVLGGDRKGIDAVLADPRLSALGALPSRFFGDIGEPRRALLDEAARRATNVEITVRSRPITTGPDDEHRTRGPGR